MSKKYSPMKDYKGNLHPDSLMHGDAPFKLVLDNSHVPTVISSPERGEFTIHKMPFGFYLHGYGGENQFTVLLSAGQGGLTSVHVVSSSCDNSCSHLTKNVPWTDEIIAVNDMLNKLYFGVKTNKGDKVGNMSLKVRKTGTKVKLVALPTEYQLKILNKHGDFRLCNKYGHTRLLCTVPSKKTPSVPTTFECPIGETFTI